MAVLVLALAAFSCSKDENLTPQEDVLVPMEFFVGTESDGTKTKLNSDNTVSFVSDDRISVFDGSGNREFSTSDSGSKVKFSGQVTRGATAFKALYPYQSGASLSGSNISATIPAAQTAVEGTFDPAANLSVAQFNKGNTFTLKNICTLIMFQVNEACTKVKITGSTPIAGTVSINPSTGVATGGSSNTVTMTSTFTTGKTYYAAILPGERTLTFEITPSSGTAYTKTTKSITFIKSKFLDVGKLEKPAPPAPDGTVDLGLSVYWATCNVGASSPEQYGDYYTWGDTNNSSSRWGFFDKGIYWDTKDATTPIPTIPTYIVYTFTNYNTNKNLDTTKHDVAYKTKGDGWRMPTKEEFKELTDNCTRKEEKVNGILGITLTSKINGNSIFLPYAGASGAGTQSIGNSGAMGWYWTSSCASSNMFATMFSCVDTGGYSYGTNDLSKVSANSIRPVHTK